MCHFPRHLQELSNRSADLYVTASSDTQCRTPCTPLSHLSKTPTAHPLARSSRLQQHLADGPGPLCRRRREWGSTTLPSTRGLLKTTSRRRRCRPHDCWRYPERQGWEGGRNRAVARASWYSPLLVATIHRVTLLPIPRSIPFSLPCTASGGPCSSFSAASNGTDAGSLCLLL